MSKDYYRPVIAIRVVNYIDGDGKVHNHTLQFRREHSDQWIGVPVLAMPYGSDSDVKTDSVGYDDGYDEVEDIWWTYPEKDSEVEQNPLQERVKYLETLLEATSFENSNLQEKVKSTKHELEGWKNLYLKWIEG